MTERLPRMNLRTNTVDAVANQLRREIVQAMIPPGDRILPNELAARFSVSHIPIREALRRLEAEGLVVSSRGGTYAANVGIEDLAGIYELRRVVEGEFAWRSANVKDERAIARVDEAWASLGDAEPFSDAFFLAHRTFHAALLLPAATKVTQGVLDGLWQSVDRYLAIAVSRDPSFRSGWYAEEAAREHAGLHQAFRAGQADLLRARLLSHLTMTEDRLGAAFGAQLGSASIGQCSPWPGTDGLAN